MELSHSFKREAKVFGLFIQGSISIMELFTLKVMLKSLNTTSQTYFTVFR